MLHIPLALHPRIQDGQQLAHMLAECPTQEEKKALLAEVNLLELVLYVSTYISSDASKSVRLLATLLPHLDAEKKEGLLDTFIFRNNDRVAFLDSHLPVLITALPMLEQLPFLKKLNADATLAMAVCNGDKLAEILHILPLHQLSQEESEPFLTQLSKLQRKITWAPHSLFAVTQALPEKQRLPYLTGFEQSMLSTLIPNSAQFKHVSALLPRAEQPLLLNRLSKAHKQSLLQDLCNRTAVPDQLPEASHTYFTSLPPSRDLASVTLLPLPAPSENDSRKRPRREL